MGQYSQRSAEGATIDAVRAGRNPALAMSAKPAVMLWLGPVDLVSRMPEAVLADAGGVAGRRTVLWPMTVAALSASLAEGTVPDAVFSALFWRAGDVLEVARVLSVGGYRGRYRVIVPPLPQPDMVRREVRAAHPELDFDLIPLERKGSTPG